jgi:hypothetical protein
MNTLLNGMWSGPRHAVTVTSADVTSPLQPDDAERIDAYWRAANYLSVGQIYLWPTRCCANRCGRSRVEPQRFRPGESGADGVEELAADPLNLDVRSSLGEVPLDQRDLHSGDARDVRVPGMEQFEQGGDVATHGLLRV